MSTTTADLTDLDLDSMRIVGKGSFRTVYGLDDTTVVKHARFEEAVDQNRKEVSMYERMPEEDRQYFARPIAWSPNYDNVAFERCFGTVYEREGGWPNDDRIRQLREVIGRKYYLRDLHVQNIGYRADGTPVILDYAM